MQLYADQGERSLALAQFNACRDLLHTELNVAPSAETVALARELAASEGVPVPVTANAEPPREPKFEALGIAVLPFTYDAADPQQRFLAEGLAEDLITELSRFKDLLVIARQSSFALAAEGADAATVSARLGVRYVLGGRVRRSGNTVRVVVQLVDGPGNRNVWAERYDRQVADIFAVQDEIARALIGAIDGQVRLAERERASRKPPANMDAWELFHRGLWHAYHFTPEDEAVAEDYFREALLLAPRFALPHAGLAYVGLVRITWFMTREVDATLAAAIAHARDAVALDGTSVFSQVVLGRLLTYAGQVDRALDHLKLATDLNPGFAQAHFGLAQALFWSGRYEEALVGVDRALLLNPRDPLSAMFHTLKAFSHYVIGQFEAAEQAARNGMQLQARESWVRLALAAALMARGKLAEARQTVADALRIDPNVSILSFDAVVRHVPDAIRQRAYGALREAGLP